MARTKPRREPPLILRRSARLEATRASKDITHRVNKHKAPPRSKPQKQECTTCGRKLAISSFPKALTATGCNHAVNTCKACIKAWIAASLDSNTFDKLACPECPQMMHKADIQMHAAKNVYARYEELERRAILDKTPGWRWCLDSECKAGKVHLPLLFSDEEKAARDVEQARKDGICACDECGAQACVACDRPEHTGQTCAEYRHTKKNDVHAQAENKTLKTIEKHCKSCPGCKKSIEKNGGCDSVFCTQCNVQFCWICLTKYSVINVSGHAKSCVYAQPDRHDPHAMHVQHEW